MAEQLCRNNRGKHGCSNIVTDGGIEDSGFCEDCYTPELAQNNESFHQYVEEGYSRAQASLLAGLEDSTPTQTIGGEIEPDQTVAQTGTEYEVPVKRYGSVPITTIQQDAAARDDSEDDEDSDEDAEEEGTNHLLDQIDNDNNTPEIEFPE